jgi:hypothetical protein
MGESQQPTTAKFSELVAAHGAEFQGLQYGPRGTLVIFTDLITRTTLALAESEFCAEALSRRLWESRRSFRVD